MSRALSHPVATSTRHRELPWLSFLSVLLLAGLLAAFLAWAALSQVEEVTRGQGRVVPSSREQVIQSLDPGVLTEMLVREGDSVDKGQLLLRIDDTRASALYGEQKAKSEALAASAARLRAEAYGSRLEFPAEVLKRPALVQRETEAFQARRRALDESAASLTSGMKLLDREIQITEPMVARGLVSEVELLRLKRQRNDLAMQLNDRQNKFRADAAADLVKYEADLAQTRESMLARADAYHRTEIRSPMKGTVKSIRINTIGGVIQPGQDIMVIVPSDEALQVEAYVKPADVAFLHPGQRAIVKLSAYDYAIYGGLEGIVENISPDTVRDERRDSQPVADATDDQHSFYRVLIRTTETALSTPNGQKLPIIPGMTATVEMLSGRKTVLQYLLKPLNRAQEALRER